MERKVQTKIKGYRTVDGAGVSLVRVLGNQTMEEFDPILMLDSFDSTNPKDYIAGFPMHPHRGIETISYLSRGKMVHRDTLGNEEAIGDGEVQWMNAGSGILHEEMVPAADRLLGVQLWLNLPAHEKMSQPTYHSIKKEEIPEVSFDAGKIRVLAGSYKDIQGYKGEHWPIDYYDIHFDQEGSLELSTEMDDFVMIFTLLGDVIVGDTLIEEKTAVRLTPGTSIHLKSHHTPSQVLFIRSKPLKEPIAWAGPIVMNTQKELEQAFTDLQTGQFSKEKAQY